MVKRLISSVDNRRPRRRGDIVIIVVAVVVAVVVTVASIRGAVDIHNICAELVSWEMLALGARISYSSDSHRALFGLNYNGIIVGHQVFRGPVGLKFGIDLLASFHLDGLDVIKAPFWVDPFRSFVVPEVHFRLSVAIVTLAVANMLRVVSVSAYIHCLVLVAHDVHLFCYRFGSGDIERCEIGHVFVIDVRVTHSISEALVVGLRIGPPLSVILVVAMRADVGLSAPRIAHLDEKCATVIFLSF